MTSARRASNATPRAYISVTTSTESDLRVLLVTDATFKHFLYHPF
jgi:hypothetical protein